MLEIGGKIEFGNVNPRARVDVGEPRSPVLGKWLSRCLGREPLRLPTTAPPKHEDRLNAAVFTALLSRSDRNTCGRRLRAPNIENAIRSTHFSPFIIADYQLFSMRTGNFHSSLSSPLFILLVSIHRFNLATDHL